MLELREVRAGYGDAVVLDGISLALPEGGTLALLGRNGVGKSTLLLTLMGYTRLRKGDVLWNGKSIARLAPHRRARLGIGWVAQEREIFPSLTVQENLTVAGQPGPRDLPKMLQPFPRLAVGRAASGAASALRSTLGASGVSSRMRCCASRMGMSSWNTRTMSPAKIASIAASARPKLRTKP